MRFEFS